MSPEFFQTMMGKRFYECHVPLIADALSRIAVAMEHKASPAKVEENKCPTALLSRGDMDVVKEMLEEIANAEQAPSYPDTGEMMLGRDLTNKLKWTLKRIFSEEV